MPTSRSVAAAVGAIATMALGTACTSDLPTHSPAPDLPPPAVYPVSLDIVSFDESGALLRATEGDGNPVYLTIGDPEVGEQPRSGEPATAVWIEEGDQPQAFLLPAALLALRVWAAVETIRVCAIPVYREIRNSNTVSSGTAEACATEVATSVTGGILAKATVPAVRVTALRNSIKWMVGSVITHRQLQSVINRNTKASITELVRQMTSIFYSQLLSGYARVFQEHGVR